MSGLIQRVVDNYRSLKSYSDIGSVVTEIAGIGRAGREGKTLKTGCDFVTQFSRNSVRALFRYQWTATGHFADMKEDNLNFICSNAEGVFNRYPEDGLSTCESLTEAVADATALSFGGTYYMSTLLIDGVVPERNWFFNRLVQAEAENAEAQTLNDDFAEDDFADGEPEPVAGLVYQLKDETVNLFIDTESLLLNRLVVMRPTSTTTFVWKQVEPNAEIDVRVFDQYRF